MIEQWREWLYPLGFIASIAFGSRIVYQWLTSETRKTSVVTPLFWKLSLIGNATLWLHAVFQLQGHVALIQACNGVISWRNLNLMGPQSKQISFSKTVCILLLILGVTAIAFTLQGGIWFRIPQAPWQTYAYKQVSYLWHTIGCAGLILFNSRFWLQWFMSERVKISHLGSSFWWASLIGDTFCLAYFLRIGDAVNFVGPVLGLIPYIRNLVLIRKMKRRELMEKG